MSLNAQYRQDLKTTWIEPAANVQLEVAHFDPRQPEYLAIITKITKPVRKLVEQNLLAPGKDREYAVKAFCEACVKGWRTVVTRDEDGNALTTRPEIETMDGEWESFTQDVAVAVFTKYPQFYSDTVEAARDLTNFQVSEEEEKNSASA